MEFGQEFRDEGPLPDYRDLPGQPDAAPEQLPDSAQGAARPDEWAGTPGQQVNVDNGLLNGPDEELGEGGAEQPNGAGGPEGSVDAPPATDSDGVGGPQRPGELDPFPGLQSGGSMIMDEAPVRPPDGQRVELDLATATREQVEQLREQAGGSFGGYAERGEDGQLSGFVAGVIPHAEEGGADDTPLMGNPDDTAPTGPATEPAGMAEPARQPDIDPGTTAPAVEAGGSGVPELTAAGQPSDPVAAPHLDSQYDQLT